MPKRWSTPAQSSGRDGASGAPSPVLTSALTPDPGSRGFRLTYATDGRFTVTVRAVGDLGEASSAGYHDWGDVSSGSLLYTGTTFWTDSSYPNTHQAGASLVLSIRDSATGQALGTAFVGCDYWMLNGGFG